jgi:hypothetical protein
MDATDKYKDDFFGAFKYFGNRPHIIMAIDMPKQNRCSG